MRDVSDDLLQACVRCCAGVDAASAPFGDARCAGRCEQHEERGSYLWALRLKRLSGSDLHAAVLCGVSACAGFSHCVCAAQARAWRTSHELGVGLGVVACITVGGKRATAASRMGLALVVEVELVPAEKSAAWDACRRCALPFGAEGPAGQASKPGPADGWERSHAAVRAMQEESCWLLGVR